MSHKKLLKETRKLLDRAKKEDPTLYKKTESKIRKCNAHLKKSLLDKI